MSHAKESDSSSHRLLNMVQWIKQQEAIGIICRGNLGGVCVGTNLVGWLYDVKGREEEGDWRP